jgi:O-antigen/teichoic acid export membrane protein
MIEKARSMYPVLLGKVLGDGLIGKTMRRSATASGWMTVSLFILTATRLLSNLVLARLLSPEAFGIVAAGTMIVMALNMLSDVGLGQSVVKSQRGEEKSFLDTLYSIQILRGLVIALCLVLAGIVIGYQRDAFPVGSTYTIPVTAWIIASLAVHQILFALLSPRFHLARRRLQHGKISTMEVAARFVDMPVMFLAAWLGAGPWALVLGQVANVLVLLIGSFTWLKGPKIGLSFNRDVAQEIFSYGKWLLVASVSTIAILRGDQFIFSAAFSVETFSLYIIAGIWVKATGTIINKIISSVAFAALSEVIRTAPAQTPRIYKRFRALSDIMAISAFVILMFGHEWFFNVFYPDDFASAARFVPFIAIALLFLPYHLLNQVSLAAGDSFNFMWIKVSAALGVVILVPYVLHQFGENAAVFTFSVIGAVTIVPSMLAARRHMKLDLATEIRLPVIIVLTSAWILTTHF